MKTVERGERYWGERRKIWWKKKEERRKVKGKHTRDAVGIRSGTGKFDHQWSYL